MEKLDELALAMLKFDAGDANRSQHFIKVHSFARLIGLSEGLDEKTLYTLEAAAYVHDIGILVAERELGRCNGKLQELYGPPAARKMLEELGFEPKVTDRVCWLVGHHHTYTDVVGDDYRILLEADFIVNAHEYALRKEALYAPAQNIFKTETGTRIYKEMFGLE